MSNPLLKNTKLPQFNKFKLQHFLPAINKILKENRAKLCRILKNRKFTWDNLIAPLEDMDNRLHNTWAIISHLHSVANSKSIRKIYNEALLRVTQYSTELLQNYVLYQAISFLTKSPAYKKFNQQQKKVIADKLRDFRLSGVALPAREKKQFMRLQQKLSKLTQKFSNNVLDATQGWIYVATAKEIKGIPEYALAVASSAAKSKKRQGWLFTLDAPSYLAVITYADSRALRKKIYIAYVTRASDRGPNKDKWDNSKVMLKILSLRQQMAVLLGFKNYAELSLATKMVKTPQQVLQFLSDLAGKTRKTAKQELRELKQFTYKNYGIKKLQPWDLAYYSEKLYQHQYKISQQQLRPYFPVTQVLTGMFDLVHKLYGINIKEQRKFDAWHKDARLFKIYAKNQQLLGYLYFDLYTRSNKQNGAWMHDSKTRRRLKNGALQKPVTYIACNFTPPVRNKPILLTHSEVNTLFHEFGHALHHLLTKVDYVSISGINGVLWDAVELPSQFMENWCWQPQVLKKISKNYKTGKSLEDGLIRKLRRAKNFQTGLQMLRQLELALFDFRMHMETTPKKPHNFIQKTLDAVRDKISVVPSVKFNRFQNSFLHIFSHGYAAGYYSYKWAEVLAADAFAKFLTHGLFDRKTARSFLHNILEQGGAEDPMVLFKKFRGREPKIDALLKQSGIMKK